MSTTERQVSITHLKSSIRVAERCIVADRFWSRLKGLLGRGALASGEGMLFPRCNNVHMWGMKISIDILFLKKGSESDRYRVSTIRAGARPWRLLPLVDFRASEALEIAAGEAARIGIRPGDELCINS